MLSRTLIIWIILQCFYMVTFIVARQLIDLKIVFYSSLVLIPLSWVISGIFMCIVSSWNNRFRTWMLGNRDSAVIIISALLYVLSSYSFIITVPTLLDRSISYYILGTIYQSGISGVKANEIEQHFIEGFVKENGAVYKRLDEQLVSGNISKNTKGFYVMTSRGRAIYHITLFLSHLYNVDDRYIVAAGLQKTREKIPHP